MSPLRLRSPRYMAKSEGLKRVLLKRCPYCGAESGEFCVSKNGVTVKALGQIHDARLTTKPLRRRPLKFF